MSMSARAGELTARRVPFVHATVVRAQVPASARPGDDAIVLADGSIEGFVGGQCTEGSVRAAALDTLRDGQSTLLRVLPDGGAAFPDTPGAQVVVNPCLSGGALEIFLQPVLPSPLLEVLGDTPITRALARIADVLGYAVRPAGSSGGVPTAVVVATHGRDEQRAIRAALDSGVGYVALVASPRRGAAVLDDLGLSEDERARISTPAGLDLHARTAGEIALSILAELVAEYRGGRLPVTAAAAPAVTQALDPVCGMTVTVAEDTPRLAVGGEYVWFCGTHCRDRYAQTAGT